MSQSINQFWKQETHLLPRDHAMHNVNPNLDPNHNPIPNDLNSTKRNPNMNQLMHLQLYTCHTHMSCLLHAIDHTEDSLATV